MSSIGETPGTLEEDQVGFTVATRLPMEEHQTTPVQEEDTACSDKSSSNGNSKRSIVSDVSGNVRNESDTDTEDGRSRQETLHESGISRSGYFMSVTTLSGISRVTGSVGCSRCDTPERDHICQDRTCLKGIEE